MDVVLPWLQAQLCAAQRSMQRLWAGQGEELQGSATSQPSWTGPARLASSMLTLDRVVGVSPIRTHCTHTHTHTTSR